MDEKPPKDERKEDELFGNKSQPSKIYSYGCKPPAEGLAIVEEQMRLAHRYRNALVEQELKRRAAVEDLLRELAPALRPCEERIAEAEVMIEACVKRQNVANAAERSKKRARDPALAAEIKDRRGQLRLIRAERKAIRTAIFEDEAFQARQAVLDAEDLTARKSLRSASGLYWGTYLGIEQSMGGTRSGAPPRFQRWTGDGRLLVQLQGGITWAEATSGKDTRIRIRPLPERSTPRRQRVEVAMRVQSTDDGEPVWARMVTTLHRPWPSGARLKWVYLLRRRVACSYEWRVQFVLSMPSWPARFRGGSGACGVNLGWRAMPGGAVRCGFAVGSDGQWWDLRISERDMSRWERADTLRAQRDINFNAAREALLPWLRSREDLPDWLLEARKTMHAWRACARLAALAVRWRGARFSGDEGAFAALEAWRHQDRHLYEWEAHQRVKAVRWRDDQFRRWAAELATRYERIVVDDSNWKEVQRDKTHEDDAKILGGRDRFRAVASGRFRQILEETGRAARASAERTTVFCWRCGCQLEGDRAGSLFLACQEHGHVDQDENAARNLLATGEVIGDSPEPLDVGPVSGDVVDVETLESSSVTR